jgi:hypothetical protein
VIARLNDWLALKSTLALGTMWCAYAFIVMCLLPALFPAWQNAILYWSNCFQLVFLPMLLVGQNIQGRKAEERAQQDHDAIMAELDLMKSLHIEVHAALGLSHASVTVDAQ